MKLPQLSLRDLFWLVLGVAGVLTAGCSPQPPESHPVLNAEQNALTVARSHFDRAVALQSKGEDEEAIASYSQSLSVDATNAVAYNNRGHLWLKKGKLDQALIDLCEAIRLKPEYADAFYNRGRAQFDKGEPDKAIADFTEAIRINSKDADAYSGGGKGDILLYMISRMSPFSRQRE